jgi:hypothetical protein
LAHSGAIGSELDEVWTIGGPMGAPWGSELGGPEATLVPAGPAQATTATAAAASSAFR